MNKKVYTCFCTDIIHEGHMNIIREAKKYGEVIVGVMSDVGRVRYNRFPTKSFEERWRLVESIPEVDQVVVQNEIGYDEIVEKYRPDYIIHGSNWNEEPLIYLRNNAINAMKSYGGQVIDVPYTNNSEVSKKERKVREKTGMPEYRRGRLKWLIDSVPIVKTIEVHNGITGLIAEKTIVNTGDGLDQFDAMWISSLCDSVSKGKPDIELVDMTSRFATIDEVMEVTTKPIIFDADTGRLPEHFVYTVRTLERMGVSAVIIEDKEGLKKNSLYGIEVPQTQADINDFCKKIKAGKDIQLTDEFMIIARIESLILEKGIEDALMRAFAYIDAGADGIMIHSKSKNPDEVFEFCDRFREKNKDCPLVVVPTSYNSVYEEDLIFHGANVVIYANHMTRSAYPAMDATARSILYNHRAAEIEEELMSIKDILSLITEL